MYTRYDVRNTCFRKSKGKPVKHPDIIESLEPLIKEKNWGWHTFGKTWDVIIHKKKGVLPVPYVTDLPKVESVCSQMKLVSQHNIEQLWDNEEQSIIELIESQFLDGIMEWNNYREEWGVKKEPDTDRIVTYLLKRKSNQIEVTQEMIDAKIKAQMSSNTTEEAREKVNTVQTTINLGE